jgi:16S rRNA (guanine(1405)-N(7))-methyltransferase
MDEQLERLVAEVLMSRKYAHITPGLISRIGSAELGKNRKFKEAVKATKNKLHQVGGAYQITAPKYQDWLAELSASAHDAEQLKTVCLSIMANHSSTNERLPILDEFYSWIFSSLPAITSILDIACGLNPLSIPWMPLQAGTTYYACDMYADMVEFIGDFMKLMPFVGHTQVCDVVADPPNAPVDLALALKTIPCLEQIDKQAGTRLLDGLNARYLVISFPAKSLGGYSKGMVENYEIHFEELTAGRGWDVQARLEFGTELVFVIKS